MIYLTETPQGELSELVHQFVFYQDYAAEHKIERLLPDGFATLVIDFADTPKAIYDNETLRPIQDCSDAWFSGLQTEFLSIDSGIESKMLVVSFYPSAVFKLTGLDQHPYLNRVVQADAIFGNSVTQLRSLLQAEADHQEYFTIVGQWLIAQLQSIDFASQVVCATVEQVREDEGSIEQIARQSGYSQKQYIQRFKQVVGITPKLLQRIYRFNNILARCHRELAVDWAQEANRCGYHDQAHFIRDFQRFSGLNPSDYQKRKSEWANYIPIK